MPNVLQRQIDQAEERKLAKFMRVRLCKHFDLKGVVFVMLVNLERVLEFVVR
jgi:hypothetical protein